jgi:3',5'-cyclic-AMP phosphodiesterase
MRRKNLICSQRLTRRSFLALCLAGCTVATRRIEWEEPRETSWALISDTHISSTRDRVVRGSCMAANLQRVVEDVVSVGPDHVLFNGDLAYLHGEQADYAAFKELIAPLRERHMAVHQIVGNHDDRARFVETFEVAANAGLPEKAAGRTCIGGVDWFFLDSLEQTNAIRGSLGPEQRAWLAQSLDSSTAPAVVCVHHNPGPSLVGLKDTEELLSIILPRRRVKVVLSGHTHVFRVQQKEGLHFVNLPATGYRFFDSDVPLGWLRASFRGDGMRLALRGIGSSGQSNGSVLDLPWRSDA